MTNKAKSIKLGNRSSGIEVAYVKSKRVIRLGGWYDSFVAIEGGEMPLGEFLRQLGITTKDVFREGLV